MHPLATLAIGIFTVIGLILFLRVNAFIALIVAAIAVSCLAPPPASDSGLNQISRVAVAFGEATGKIGIVIALAAVIGQCMMDSGAADRIVRFFLRLLGQKRAPMALMGSGFVLSVPVFFDTVFYLLVPLARSLYKRTRQNYLLYLLAIAAGGTVTHTLVPPTPGPLVMAATLNVDVGTMILVGTIIGLPVSLAGLVFASVANRIYDIPMRPIGNQPDAEPIPDDQLPPLGLSILPVLLPVLMISSDTVAKTMAKAEAAAGVAVSSLEPVVKYTSLLGDPNLALLVSTAIAIYVYYRQRRPSADAIAQMVEVSLMSGGVIILITAGGGAFGAMLKEAQIGPAIQALFQSESTAGGGTMATSGLFILFLSYGIAALMKIAQGSGTVSMITTSAMIAAMITSPESLGYHPAYLATAIGAGSLTGSWMNDSGFWVFAKMGGLTEIETLKTWTILLIVLGITAMAFTVLLAMTVPMVNVA